MQSWLTAVSHVRPRVTHLDLGEHNVDINGTKALAQQLCIPAEFAELGAIQVLHRHPHSKACERHEDLSEGACIYILVCSTTWSEHTHQQGVHADHVVWAHMQSGCQLQQLRSAVKGTG